MVELTFDTMPQGRLRRTVYLSGVFLTGRVRKLTAEQATALEALWRQLSPSQKMRELKELKTSSQNRRASMTENATKGGLVLSALGFVVAVVAFIMPHVKGTQLLLAKVGIGMLILSAIVIVWMNMPKLKLLRHKKGRIVEGARRLQAMVAFNKQLAEDPEGAGFDEYLRATNIREKRDTLTLVERRALLYASMCYVGGLLIVALPLFAR